VIIMGPEEIEKKTEEESEDSEVLQDVNSVNIKIFGVGRFGSNLIDHLMQEKEKLSNKELIALDTDEEHLNEVAAKKKVLLGPGHGAIGDPGMGEKRAVNSKDKIVEHIEGSDLIFLIGGMGGGTGTGALPVIADIAKGEGACVFGVVALPLISEGKKRMENAKNGLLKMEKSCHAMNVIPNDRSLNFRSRSSHDPVFKMTEDILIDSIEEVIDIIIKPGLVNIDYNDLRTIMEDGELLMVGKGKSQDLTNRIEEAIEQAFNSSLLDEIDISGSKGALVRVTGGESMTVSEAEKAAQMVNERMGEDARIILGYDVEEDLEEMVKVYLVITNVHQDVEEFFSWYVKKKIDELRKELKTWRYFLD